MLVDRSLSLNIELLQKRRLFRTGRAADLEPDHWLLIADLAERERHVLCEAKRIHLLISGTFIV